MYIVFLDYTPISVIKLLNITYIFQWQSSKSIIIRKHSSSSSISYPFCVHPSCIIRSLFIIYTRSSADILQYHCNKNTFHFPKQKNTIPNRFFFKGKQQLPSRPGKGGFGTAPPPKKRQVVDSRCPIGHTHHLPSMEPLSSRSDRYTPWDFLWMFNT